MFCLVNPQWVQSWWKGTRRPGPIVHLPTQKLLELRVRISSGTNVTQVFPALSDTQCILKFILPAQSIHTTAQSIHTTRAVQFVQSLSHVQLFAFQCSKLKPATCKKSKSTCAFWLALTAVFLAVTHVMNLFLALLICI